MNETAGKNQIPLTRIQKLIGKRMLQSKRNKPCFYIELKADVTELMALRPTLKKKLGIKITTNAFYVHALGLAAKEYPLMVGRPEGGNVRVADSINVGFAVNAPQGLVVPVIKQADRKSLAEIARLEESLTAKARGNKLTLEDIEGETIALSNLGVYGIDSFVGIVPPPTSTILSVGNPVPAAVPVDGRFSIRKMVSLTVAADSRIIEPAYAAQFLNRIKGQLQNPEQLT
jgi:pyruvate dehydrogenase E2 component (dihydrolipoamide acetyltransferase)